MNINCSVDHRKMLKLIIDHVPTTESMFEQRRLRRFQLKVQSSKLKVKNKITEFFINQNQIPLFDITTSSPIPNTFNIIFFICIQ